MTGKSLKLDIIRKMEKELRSLLVSFEKAKEWDWSDLIQWIKKLKSLFDNYQGESFTDKIILEKRLWQCLNPSLPQGLHSITLKIYESILSKTLLSTEDFALFLTGMLGFFQYASGENRCYVISILSNYYVDRISKMKLSLKGVVTAVLPGLDQDSIPEVERRTTDFLDAIALNGTKNELFYSVWQALLTTPRVRLGALTYLTKRIPRPDDYSIEDIIPNKILAVNSLIAALGDTELIVKRNTMDLIIAHFPINIDEDMITTREKILLIESVLKLFLKEDQYLTRRIQKWIYQGDSEPTQDVIEYGCELLIEAMKSILNTEHSKPTDPIQILQQLFLEKYLAENLIRELIVPMLIHAEKYKDDKESNVLSKCISLLRSDECLACDYLILEALNYFFEENINSDFMQAVKVIRFYFTYFPSFNINIESIKQLFISILLSMHNLGQQQLSATLSLAHSMSKRFENHQETDITRAVKTYQEFFVQFCREEGVEITDFKVAANLVVSLEKFSGHNFEYEWLDCLKDFTEKSAYMISADSNSHFALEYDLPIIKIQCIIRLLKSGTDRIKNKIQGELVMIDMIEKLWEILDSPQYYELAVELLLELEKVSHENFVSVILSKISCKEEAEIESCLYNIKIFILFWKTARVKSYEDFQQIFRQGEILNVLIQHLDLDLPEVSYKTGQWLIEALPDLACVLSPTFNELLSNLNQTFIPDSFLKLSHGIKQLIKIVKHGGDLIIQRAYEVKIPGFLAEQLVNTRAQQSSYKVIKEEEVETTFLQLMVEACLLVLLQSEKIDDSCSRSILRVKVSACEFLIMILRQKYQPLAYLAVDSILNCLKKTFDAQEITQEVLHLQLLNILNIIFFDCEISLDPSKCKTLLESQTFIEIYLKGPTKKDDYIKFRWINFIVKSFPLILTTVSPGVLEDIVCGLIKSYCEELSKTINKQPLIKGLKLIIHTALDSNIRNEIITKIKENLPLVIESLIGCCKSFRVNLDISTLGTKPFKNSSEPKIVFNNDVIELLKPLMDRNQTDVMYASFLTWLKISQEKDPTTETNEKLIKLLGMIISLNTSSASIFTGLKYPAYLIHYKKPVDIEAASRLAHFLYSLICFMPIDQFDSDINLWDLVVYFCKELEKVEHPSVVIWINEIINLLLYRLNFQDKNKNIYRSLYEYIQKTIKNLTKICLSNEYYSKKQEDEEEDEEEKKKNYINYPYPPSLCEFNLKFLISNAALVSLKSTLHSTVTILWRKESQEKIIYQFQFPTSQFLQTLTNKTSNVNLDTQVMSELLASLLTYGKLSLAKLYRKEIMDYFTSSYFFSSMNESTIWLKSWSQIIRCISNSCYGDRYSLITELISKMYTGVFTTSTTNALRMKCLKCISFVIYSGQVDEYHSCTQMICEELIKFVKIEDPDIKQNVYQCTVVMLLRLSSEALNDLWPRLWPHLLTDIWQILTESIKNPAYDNLYHKSIFIFIDILTILMNQDFQLYKWMFFYESIEAYNDIKKKKEDLSDSFVPLLAQLGLNKDIGLRDDIELDEKIYRETVSTLMLKDGDIESTDSKHMIRKMMRDVIRSSQMITVPCMESIKARIETGFF
jgi:Dopey, N-terminal